MLHFARFFTSWKAAVLLLLLVGVVYSNSLDGPFVLDDVSHIQNNSFIRQLWPLNLVFDPPYQKGGVFFSRPFIHFTMCVDFAIWGTTPRGYHITNLLFYMVSIWVLFNCLKIGECAHEIQ